ncbi:MAG: Uma2 family endonuclease [Spirochaetaceae bacterium]|nr:Uma2 family endonuclease [Spirochaetaceae bacterium]
MGLPEEKSDQKFTYIDYKSWPENERWELIDGLAYDMSPAPSSRHQWISSEISRKIGNHLENSSCKTFSAPFDVMLSIFPIQDENKIDTIVQPDISVICDPSKITEKGCLGSPDLIVEILSPSTSKRDLNEKFGLYEKHLVKEYWVVDPGNRYIQVFHLIVEIKKDGKKEGKYDEGTLIPPADWHDTNTIAESLVLDGFKLDVKALFDSLG